MYNANAIGHNNPPTELEILSQRLSDNYTDLDNKIYVISSMDFPDHIENEEDAGKITDRIKSMNAVKKDVAEAHKKEKAVFLECGRAVDAWKTARESAIASQVQKATKPLQDFLDRKAAAERARQLEIARKEREAAAKLEDEANAHAAEGLIDTAGDLLDAAAQRDEKAAAIEAGQFQSRAKARSTMGASAGQKLVWTGEIESPDAIDLEALRPYFTLDALQKAVNGYVRDGGRDLRGVRIYQKSTIQVR